MLVNNQLLIGKTVDKKELAILPQMANRHGLITGASGSGKTVTLKVMAESFSDAGVPVFLADVKGDLAGTAVKGEVAEAIQKRLAAASFDPAGDRRKMAPVREAWERYAALVRDRGASPPFDEDAAERYRWLVEEYRVAVFAQALGTAEPASRPRLDRLWAEVVG